MERGLNKNTPFIQPPIPRFGAVALPKTVLALSRFLIGLQIIPIAIGLMADELSLGQGLHTLHLLKGTPMDLFMSVAVLLGLAALFGLINERFLGLQATIGLMLLALAMTLALILLKLLGGLDSDCRPGDPEKSRSAETARDDRQRRVAVQ